MQGDFPDIYHQWEKCLQRLLEDAACTAPVACVSAQVRSHVPVELPASGLPLFFFYPWGFIVGQIVRISKHVPFRKGEVRENELKGKL